MKITYTPNPLNTIIELSEEEKKTLWYKIKVEQLQEAIENAEFYLSNQKFKDEKKALSYLDTMYISGEDDNEKSQLDKHCDTILNYYIADLQSSHAGDCTCFAASCTKCAAESLLGIDTIPGLRKHVAHNIMSAFGSNNEKTLDEALASLEHFHIDPAKFDTDNWKKIGGYEQYLPRWKEEHYEAFLWLSHYKEKHFKDIK